MPAVGRHAGMLLRPVYEELRSELGSAYRRVMDSGCYILGRKWKRGDEVLILVISHFLAERPYRWSWAWRSDYAKTMWDFGWPLLLNGFVMFAAQQGDQMIVGAKFSMEELALYSVAFTLTSLPWMIFAQVGGSLMLPLLSGQQEDRNQFDLHYHRCLELSVIASLLILGPLVVAGDPLVRLLYGPKYSEAGSLMVVFGAVVALRFFRWAPALAAMARLRPGNAHATLGVAGLRDLPRARGRGEPAEGTPLRPRLRPHELHPLLGQRVPRPSHGRRVRPAPGPADPARGHPGGEPPSRDAPRAAVQARGPRAGLGPPDRPAPPERLPLVGPLAGGGHGARGESPLTAHDSPHVLRPLPDPLGESCHSRACVRARQHRHGASARCLAARSAFVEDPNIETGAFDIARRFTLLVHE
jgi:hypothetical protein